MRYVEEKAIRKEILQEKKGIGKKRMGRHLGLGDSKSVSQDPS